MNNVFENAWCIWTLDLSQISAVYVLKTHGTLKHRSNNTRYLRYVQLTRSRPMEPSTIETTTQDFSDMCSLLAQDPWNPQSQKQQHKMSQICAVYLLKTHGTLKHRSNNTRCLRYVQLTCSRPMEPSTIETTTQDVSDMCSLLAQDPWNPHHRNNNIRCLRYVHFTCSRPMEPSTIETTTQDVSDMCTLLAQDPWNPQS